MSAPTYTSYSQITTYAECGEKYRLTRIVGMEEGQAWWNAGGTAVHTATERLDNKWWEAGCDTSVLQTIAQGDFQEEFNKALDEEIEGWDLSDESIRSSRGQKEAWWRENGPGMVKNYYDWLVSRDWTIWTSMDGNPGIEYHLTTLHNDSDEESRVKSYIDRIFVTRNRNLIIADLKTGARKPSSDLQLGMYRAGLQVQEGVNANLGCYLMVRKPIVDLDAAAYMRDLQSYTPEHVERYVRTLRRGIKNEVFMPNTNSFCGTCGGRSFARHKTQQSTRKVTSKYDNQSTRGDEDASTSKPPQVL